MNTFADILNHLAPYKYNNLISPRCFHTLTQVYNLFPPWISHAFGFETELWRKKAVVDTAFCIRRVNLEHLALPSTSLLQNTSLLIHPYWNSIEKFFSLWMLSDGDIKNTCKNVWLTFDCERIQSNSIFPGIYIGIKEDCYGTGNKIPEIINFVHSMFDLFDYSIQWNEWKDTLSLCFHRLPAAGAAGFINYIGFMPCRSKKMVRISILFHDPGVLPQYLDDIGIKKHTRCNFLSAIEQYLLYCDYNILHLDIGNDIKPGIGIELRFASRELRLFSQYRWNPVIDRLRLDRLSTRNKEKDLAQWPGMEDRTLHTGTYHYTVFRFLYYLKLYYIPGKPLKAKAYFGYVFHPLAPDL